MSIIYEVIRITESVNVQVNHSPSGDAPADGLIYGRGYDAVTEQNEWQQIQSGGTVTSIEFITPNPANISVSVPNNPITTTGTVTIDLTAQNIRNTLGYTPTEEAPTDGTTYGRNNGAWVEIVGGGGDGITRVALTSPSGELAIANSPITLGTQTNDLEISVNQITQNKIVGLVSDLNAITGAINANAANIEDNVIAIGANTTAISNNRTDINTNTTAIETKVNFDEPWFYHNPSDLLNSDEGDDSYFVVIQFTEAAYLKTVQLMFAKVGATTITFSKNKTVDIIGLVDIAVSQTKTDTDTATDDISRRFERGDILYIKNSSSGSSFDISEITFNYSLEAA